MKRILKLKISLVEKRTFSKKSEVSELHANRTTWGLFTPFIFTFPPQSHSHTHTHTLSPLLERETKPTTLILNMICRSNNLSSTLVSLTIFVVAFVIVVSYASNRLSLLYLPSSPWSWSWPSINLHHHQLPLPPIPPPTRPLINPKTALYSMFNVIHLSN